MLPTTNMESVMPTYQVDDMTCGHCVATITAALGALDAGARVDIDLGAHRVKVESAQPAARIEEAIRAAGYTPTPAA